MRGWRRVGESSLCIRHLQVKGQCLNVARIVLCACKYAKKISSNADNNISSKDFRGSIFMAVPSNRHRGLRLSCSLRLRTPT